ncbi:pentatricopeptide repeat domain-containing protein [Colletotrichum camelliae]|nr:pentatricopeptide repeat domain-containing protein [Colletotrichum camelliae]
MRQVASGGHICGIDLRLIDTIDNDSDASLWLGLLNVAKREQGKDGVLSIWNALQSRKILRTADSEDAEPVWTMILEVFMDDENQLQRVVSYAEWMLEAHSARWPSLYQTIVSQCLRNGQHRRAMQWHLRLMPNFDPGPGAFGTMLCRFITDTETGLQQTLKSLYVSTCHRCLYDDAVPLLYESGLSELCAEWRGLFLLFGDVPNHTVKSEPYLRFLSRYYPGTSLKLEEQLVLEGSLPVRWGMQRESLMDVMDGTHEVDHGSTGRRYSDTLGARWFASSWLPLDFAIHAVHALGVRQIGPLSLQSIALRDPTPDAVISRIEQLHKANIGIGHSTYALAVRHFAETAEHELLHELLHTDIHPDVFDDLATLESIRDEALHAENMRTYHLLLAIQPAVAQESIDTTSNLLLQQSLQLGQARHALALMRDMRSMDIDLSTTSIEHIYSNILEPLSWNPDTAIVTLETLRTAINYLNHLMLLRAPVPGRYWQKVLFGLGKFGRLDDVEGVCIGLLDAYQDAHTVPGGLLGVHPADAPPCNALGWRRRLLIPADLPVSHAYHPLHKIFENPKLQVAIVRWGFKRSVSQELASVSVEDGKLVILRGVRLLGRLQKRGVSLQESAIRREVIRLFAQLFHSQRKKAIGRLPDLATMREQINEALSQSTGQGLLPGISVLEGLISEAVPKRRGRTHRD